MKYRYKPKKYPVSTRRLGTTKIGYFTDVRSLKDLKESRRFFMDYFYKLRKIKSRFKKLKPMPVCDHLFWCLARNPKDRVGKRPIKVLHNYLKTKQHHKRKCAMIYNYRLPYHVLIDTIYHSTQIDVIAAAITKLGNAGFKPSDKTLIRLARSNPFSIDDIFKNFKLNEIVANELFNLCLHKLYSVVGIPYEKRICVLHYYIDGINSAIEYKGDLINKQSILDAWDVISYYNDAFGFIYALKNSKVHLSTIEEIFYSTELVGREEHFTPESCIEEGDRILESEDKRFYWDHYDIAKIIVKRKGKKK